MNTETSHSETRLFLIVITLLVICFAGYGLYFLSERSDYSVETTGSTIPDDWELVPGLLCHGRRAEAEEILSDIAISAERPSRQLYLLGLLFGYMGHVETCKDLLNRAASANSPPIQYSLGNTLEMNSSALQLDRKAILQPTYDAQDALYLSRMFVLQCIGDNVLADVQPGIEQAKTLVHWIRRTVAPCEPKLYDVFPFLVLTRGFGLCDRYSWAMISIARQRDIDGFIVHLRDPESRKGVHTICQIFPSLDSHVSFLT